MRNPMDRSADWLTHKFIDSESVLVRKPHREKFYILSTVILLIVLLAAQFTKSLNPWIYWADLAVVSFFAGFGVACWTLRAQAYRHGWVDGKTQAVSALGEALERGLTMEEWLGAEAERVAYVLQAPIDLRKSEEDA